MYRELPEIWYDSFREDVVRRGEVYVLQSLRRRILIVRVGLYVGNRKTESADVRYEGVRKACHNHQRCLDPKNDYCHEQELPV